MADHTRRTVLSAGIGLVVSGLGVSSAAACSDGSMDEKERPSENSAEDGPPPGRSDNPGAAEFCPHCRGEKKGCPACRDQIENCPHCRGQQDGCRMCGR